MIDIPTEGEFSDVGLSFERETSVVPHTIGPKQKPHGEVAWLARPLYRFQYKVS